MSNIVSVEGLGSADGVNWAVQSGMQTLTNVARGQ